MATYFTDDFADFGTDWTQRYDTDPSFSVSGGDLAYPGNGGYGADWIGASWNDIDGDSDRDDIELLGLVTMQSGASDGMVFMLRGSGSDEAANHYAISLATIRMRVHRCVGTDTPTTVATFSTALTNGVDYWIRFRANGTSIRARIWADGGGEPGSWDIDTTDSNITGVGWAGAAAYNSVGGHTLQQFGVGTNGDTAPASAGGTSHPTSGTLTADAATVAGTAAHLTLHTSTGALVAQSATVAGAAVHPHIAAGILAAQAATISGAAAHGSAFAATGALTAQSAAVVGTAARLALHTATGALVAQAATVDGAANHIVVHATSGALAAGAAVVAGAAERSADGEFDAVGALAAQPATVAGAAAHLTLHTAEGAIAAGPAVIAGSAAHLTLHEAMGALVASSAVIVGSAAKPGAAQPLSASPAGRRLQLAGRPANVQTARRPIYRGGTR